MAIERSIQGTFLGPSTRSLGVIEPRGAKLYVPCADLWYMRDGKIKEFDYYVSVNSMLAQLGVLPDYAPVVAAPASAR